MSGLDLPPWTLFRIVLRSVAACLAITALIVDVVLQRSRPSADVCQTVTAVQASFGLPPDSQCAPINYDPVWALLTAAVVIFLLSFAVGRAVKRQNYL